MYTTNYGDYFISYEFFCFSMTKSSNHGIKELKEYFSEYLVNAIWLNYHADALYDQTPLSVLAHFFIKLKINLLHISAGGAFQHTGITQAEADNIPHLIRLI